MKKKMNMFMKKSWSSVAKSWICLTLGLVLTVTSFAACGKKSFETEAVQETQISESTTNYPAQISDGNEYETPYVEDSTLQKEDVSGSQELIADTAAIEYDESLKLTDAYNVEEYNTEEYNAIIENGFQSVQDYPLSTFSIDVDTASYSNIRRMIYENSSVVPDAVRIEEMINYFKYDYKKPQGKVPFSVNTELSDCPWNENSKLLLVGLQAEDIDFRERPNSNIVFLLDVSGSMDSEDKLPLMQKAFILLTENLNRGDRVSIVTYAGDERVVLEGARGDETIKIVDAIENLYAGGSTAGAAGIERAYDIAEEYFIKGGNNRVILATDGDLNVGLSSEGELTRLIEEKRKNGVYLSVLGFGTENIKDNKMEALADNGNGNYSYIDSMMEAKKVLVEEMGGTLFTVAKDVKLQLEFNPSQIKGYRLIGYENRMLDAQDFNDDTKDAGEIGAGHRVTALYELLEVDSKQELPNSNLKYQKNDKGSNSKEWLTINIRYKEPEHDKSKLISETVDKRDYSSKMPENLAFASSVAAFGMILRDSEYKGTANYDMILDTLEQLDVSSDEYKDEFVSLVKKMKRVD